MSILLQANALMIGAHAGQVDKSGRDYRFHPRRVSFRLEPDGTIAEHTAALLHDVLEDTPVTVVDLIGVGFGHNILTMLDLLTRHKGESHSNYITRLIESGNESAMRVKLADIYDNACPERFATLPREHHGLMRRYELDILRLTKVLPFKRWSRIKAGDLGI